MCVSVTMRDLLRGPSWRLYYFRPESSLYLMPLRLVEPTKFCLNPYFRSWWLHLCPFQ